MVFVSEGATEEYVTELLRQKTDTFWACVSNRQNEVFSTFQTRALADCFPPMEQFFFWGKKQEWPQSSLQILQAGELVNTCVKNAFLETTDLWDFLSKGIPCEDK